MSASVRYSRRLAEKIVFAARMACESGDEEIAVRLLVALEMAMARPAPENHRDRRKNMEALSLLRERVAAMHPATAMVPPDPLVAKPPPAAEASGGRA